MKKNIFVSVSTSVLIIFFVQCEIDKKLDIPDISVKTGKKDFIVNSKIDLAIKNNSNNQAKYFTCDTYDIKPAKIVKYINNEWIESDYTLVCAQMGPMGYNGIIDNSETKYDTVLLFNEIGLFKFRYRLIVNEEDTNYYDSNEFTISGLILK